MTEELRASRKRYSLTRSIIHDCPAVVIDDSLVELAKTARIVVLKGATDADAKLILDALNAQCSESAPVSEDELFKRWNSLWLTANEEAQAELFNQETLPPNHAEILQKNALRKTILALAKTLSGAAPVSMGAQFSGYRVFKDGNAWCATGPGFVDLQASKAGFGHTPLVALGELIVEEGEP